MKKRIKRLIIFLGICLLLLNMADVLYPLRIGRPYSQTILSAEGETLQAFLTPDDKWRMHAPIGQISPLLVTAIVEKEDRYFYSHPGFNPLAMGRALLRNIATGRTTSGASTITMQVARMLAPKPRTYANKLQELFRALQLEWHYSKDEILELYLNLAPYGGNIEGCKAASMLYFGKSPRQLSLAEAVALCIVPNRPGSWAIGRKNGALQAARNRWLRHFRAKGIFPPAQVESAIKEPLEASRMPAPKLAPHFAQWVRRQNLPIEQVQTSIHAQKQHLAQQLAQRYAQRYQGYGVHNLAILVVENASRKIVAYIGNANFSDSTAAGQVDAIQARRSPGSTLKPLLYALSFDRGLYTPRASIDDVPLDFDGYAPENFTRQFYGRINIETALANSLNLSAVRVLQQVGVSAMANALVQAEFKGVGKRRAELGLSLALGGCDASLFELCGLYAALANEGKYAPLSFLAEKDSLFEKPLLSAEAAYMTTEILSLLKRPDYPNGYEHAQGVPKVAWKTGTSYGRHDAWSIGYTPHYTIGVWVGNASGVANAQLVGAQAAAPLLFDLFNALERGKARAWFKRPSKLATRRVCAISGKPPQSWCTESIADAYIPLVSSNEKCSHLVKAFVAADESCTYCFACMPPNGAKEVLLPNISGELQAYYQLQHIAYEKAPPHNAKCPTPPLGGAPVILSLGQGRAYLLPDADSPLSLLCRASTPKIYWYANGDFIGEGHSLQAFLWKPKRGEFDIDCVDAQGRKTSIRIQVL